jgi:hypothetical protein
MNEGYRVKFKTCQHDWELHVDVENCGGPASGNGIFQCKNCKTFVTMLEKCALEQTDAQVESLLIQERHTKIGMLANIIAATTLIIAFLTFLFGDKLLQCINK